MGTLHVLDSSGDTVHSWDDPEEAVAVEAVFAALKGKGYMAANMDGSKGTLIGAFDASAGSILMIPPLRGG